MKATEQTTIKQVFFKGHYRRDLETPNWHYYETSDGCLLPFRKEHMIYVKVGVGTGDPA
jgi:hypothetical protein